MKLPTMKLSVTEQKRPNRASVLTVRANGRYLGTLFATPDEVAEIQAAITEDADSVYHPDFEWTVAGA